MKSKDGGDELSRFCRHGLFILFLLSIMALLSEKNVIRQAREEDSQRIITQQNTTRRKNSRKSHLSSLEKAFLEVPSSVSARSNLRFLTRQDHVAGTAGDEILADFMVQEFEQAGIPNGSIFNLEVYLNYPQLHRKPRLAMVRTDDESNNETIFEASLEEMVLPEDDTSGHTPWRNHIFHGYSPSGNIQGAPVVYANYGRPQDFHALKEKAGISVNGTIVLVRYGKCFRGLKVQNAQRRGAVGVLIYSDPQQDGYSDRHEENGDENGVYPDGPWRPKFGIQRGSVQFNSQCAGDPFRADPRYASQLNTTLQNICGVKSVQDLIPSIPSLPISYGDAEPILRHLGGPLANDIGGDDFVGGITNLTYRVGPSNHNKEKDDDDDDQDADTFNFVVNMDVYNTQPALRSIPNVVGVIPGRWYGSSKDRPVLLGNHRDAWVYGAADPNSGTAALLEVVKGLGTLYLDLNWRPLRTIYFLSWSGEEFGLLGSTGWAELNPTLLRKATAYLNVDTIVSGDMLSVSASPLLTTVWKDVLQDWNATQDHNHSVYSHELFDANTGRKWIEDDEDKEDIGILGSGSDFTVFLDHLGIPSLDFSFEKRSDTYGQYHSIYDSFAWMEKFGGRPYQPGSAFELIAAGSQIWGLLAIRLADTAASPLDPIAQGSALTQYLRIIERQQIHRLETSILKKTVQKFKEMSAQFQLHCDHHGKTSDDWCNDKIEMLERLFLLEEGLPKRPWFKHSLQAPGMYLGYAAEAFPGVQQAIDEGDYDTAQLQIDKVSRCIDDAAEFLHLP